MPKIIIRPQTAKEEFDFLWRILNELPFLTKEGYKVVLPDHSVFNQVAETIISNDGREQKDKPADLKELQQIFIDDVYDKNFFSAGIKVLEGYKEQIPRSFPYFLTFQKDWNFKIFPKYKILLTRYGTNGNYDADEGVIVVRTNSDGIFGKDDILETIIHEMVHIGIEENIVHKFRLTHWEKEYVVDFICKNGFPDILPDYKMQNIDDHKLEQLLSPKDLKDLPLVIGRYTQEHLR